MRRVVPPVLLLISVLIAGCHEPAPDVGDDGPEPAWSLRGTFTENTTQDDIADLDARLAPYAADLVVMESFPMQYGIRGTVEEDCPAVREMLQGLDYIADVGNCLKMVAATDPADPTGAT